MTKIAIGIVVILAFITLVVVGTSSSISSSGVQTLSSSAPLRVTVPSIDASSTLVPVGQKADKSIDVPSVKTPMQAAWYDKSPTPGSLGPAVVLGHVNGSGKPGIFYKLKDVTAGQEIMIDREDGQTAVFTVSHVDTVPKASFPAREVYGDTAGPELRLITCGGVFDQSADSYEANVVVFANLTGVRKT